MNHWRAMPIQTGANMNNPEASPPIALARLARLWPNREHESNWLKALLCYVGIHRWHRFDLSCEGLQDDIEFCRWCPRIKVDGKLSN